MKICILGGTGMIGGYCYRYLNTHYNCDNITRDQIDASSLNIQDINTIVKQYDIVINCIGVTKPVIKKLNRVDVININTVFPELVAQSCDTFNKKFIHICTDCVYKGDRGSYTEHDTPDAPDLYARTKSITPSSGSTIRTSFIGRESRKLKTGLLEWILSNKNTTINGYVNAFWNGVTCLQLCEILREVIDRDINWAGVRHLFTPDQVVTKFQVCDIVSDIYNLNLNINQMNASEIEGSIIDAYIDRSLSTIYDDIPLPGIDLYDQVLKQKIFDDQ